MFKKIMIGAALSAFAVSSAFAQASNPSTDPPANSQQQMQSGAGGGSSDEALHGPDHQRCPDGGPGGTMGAGPEQGRHHGRSEEERHHG